VTASLVYRLPSILDPLDLNEVFAEERPLELEVGSGDGSFLVEYARRHPERNFLGIERLLGRLRKADRRARRAGLANVRLISIEASYFLRYLLPPRAVTAVHVYFPDPWPKRRHQKHRLINAGFVECVARVVQAGGAVHLRTDNRDYLEQITAVFGACSSFEALTPPEELLAVVTDFEREFRAQGVPTFAVSYRAVGGTAPGA
jgi:tRNA (guanine-N7-)-methyltransferase